MQNNAAILKPAKRRLEPCIHAVDPELVVVTVTVKLVEPFAATLTDVGLTEQEAYSGAPLQFSVTLPLNPVAPVSERA